MYDKIVRTLRGVLSCYDSFRYDTDLPGLYVAHNVMHSAKRDVCQNVVDDSYKDVILSAVGEEVMACAPVVKTVKDRPRSVRNRIKGLNAI